MKNTLYIRPYEFWFPYWMDNQLLSSIHNIFLEKKDQINYVDTVSLPQLCSNDELYKDYKIVIIFPMPLDSTNLLGEYSHQTSVENKIHTRMWFILLDICLKICKKRKDTVILTGCDWDEHNISNFNNHSVIKLILERFRRQQVSLKHLVWLYNNPFVPEWLQQETIEDSDKIYSLFYSSYLPRCKTILQDIYRPTFNDKKTHWFMCLNRNPRYHRMNICYWWYRNGKKPAYFSFRHPKMDDYLFTENGYNTINNDFYDNSLDGFQNYQEFLNTLPWELDHQESNYLSVLHQDTLPKQFIQSTACYIITETYYGDDTNHKGWLTEKTLKCFAYGMPGIWLAPSFTLESVKKLGFETFSPLINESYDQEISLKNRMNMVCEELDRIQKIDDIDDWYNQGLEIYKHNLNNLVNLIDRNIIEIIENYHRDFYHTTLPR